MENIYSYLTIGFQLNKNKTLLLLWLNSDHIPKCFWCKTHAWSDNIASNLHLENVFSFSPDSSLLFQTDVKLKPNQIYKLLFPYEHLFRWDCHSHPACFSSPHELSIFQYVYYMHAVSVSGTVYMYEEQGDWFPSQNCPFLFVAWTLFCSDWLFCFYEVVNSQELIFDLQIQ